MAPYLACIKQDPARISDVLSSVGLADKINANVNRLSHGQAQRVAIARALINKADIILADEPTSALDDHNCAKVIELLIDVANRHNTALLIATHDQRLKSVIANQITL